MDRRDFIKISGAAAVAAACAPKTSAPRTEEGPEQMLMRENPRNGDRISALGFGCMRWPMIEQDGKRVIDQEAVNEMVDYAIAHGVNYFDTSPAYLMGQSEKAAGIALSRHPRENYFIATKLSNFGDQSPEASIKMYHDSFEQLRTDYFDYYLLHSIGRGGKAAFNRRYVDNGMKTSSARRRRPDASATWASASTARSTSSTPSWKCTTAGKCSGTSARSK